MLCYNTDTDKTIKEEYPMGMTLTQKILAAHAGVDLSLIHITEPTRLS